MIIDISPTIDENIAVWPGDTKFSREWLCRLSDGSNIDLSTIHSTLHLGAHADAPSHYHGGAQDIEQVDLEVYCGPAYVIDVPKQANELITWDDIKDKSGWQEFPRLLFKTGSFPNPKVFNEDFAAFSPELIRKLASLRTKIIGVDTPSVDPFSSKDLPAHQALYYGNIRNLEGLVLEHVSEGPYELIALPLKIRGADASPVRAILRSLNS